MARYGLTNRGFSLKRQSDVSSDLNSKAQARFGTAVDLSPNSVLTNLIGIFSSEVAALWEGLQAVYNSQYPGGAEGIAVDNILALNGLRRLAARPTRTESAPLTLPNGITLYGLVLYGVPGTRVPAKSIILTNATPPVSFTLDEDVIISGADNAVQTAFFSNAPQMGQFSFSMIRTSKALITTRAIDFDSDAQTTQIYFTSTPTSGSFSLSVTQFGVSKKTALLNFDATAAQLGAELTDLGLTATVTGSAVLGFSIAFPNASQPEISISDNTLRVSGSDVGSRVVNSVQSAINNLYDSIEDSYPYSDVLVDGAIANGSLNFRFGSFDPAPGRTSSRYQAQPTFAVASNTLKLNTTVTNINISNTVIGTEAKGVGTATATVDGPISVKAGNLTQIGSPVNGWTSVTNQLDCILGSDLESDKDALARRETLLSAHANGPIQAIVQRVAELPNVTAALPFQNLTSAALQMIAFDPLPTAGTFRLTLNRIETPELPYNVDAQTFQSVLRNTYGFDRITVLGDSRYGYSIDFAGSYGGQPQPLFTVSANTTGVAVNVSFGRPAKSFEIVVEGGSGYDIAKTIYDSMPAGISAYGSPILQTQGNATEGSTTITLSSTKNLIPGCAITGRGITTGATVVSVSGSSVTITIPATSTHINCQYTFTYTSMLRDQFGNPVYVSYSRPQRIPFFLAVSLLTDSFMQPGVPSSGRNPNSKFDPQSVIEIQNRLIDIGNSVPIGGQVIGLGSNGLVGSFNDIKGVVRSTVYFGTNPNPTSFENIQLLPQQVPVFSTQNTTVSYT